MSSIRSKSDLSPKTVRNLKDSFDFCQKVTINVNKFGPHSNWIPQCQNFAVKNFFFASFVYLQKDQHHLLPKPLYILQSSKVHIEDVVDWVDGEYSANK